MGVGEGPEGATVCTLGGWAQGFHVFYVWVGNMVKHSIFETLLPLTIHPKAVLTLTLGKPLKLSRPVSHL